MADKFEWPKLHVTIRGQPRVFDLAHFTPAESQLYTQHVGTGMLAGLQEPEIHTILGFEWLLQRRRNNRLAWAKFAESYTAADFVLEEDPEAEPSADGDAEPVELDPT